MTILESRNIEPISLLSNKNLKARLGFTNNLEPRLNFTNVWQKKGSARDPKHMNSLVKHGGGIMAWGFMVLLEHSHLTRFTLYW